jgi:hypothetical protein
VAGEYGGYGKAKKKLTQEEKQDLVREVRENIEECYLFERDNRREAALDLQFLAGDQWPAAVKTARGTTRPMLTINQLPQFVRQVTNPTRQADIAIKVSPVDDTSDPELAKIYNGLIKQIEYQSTAKSVYVTGNEHQTGCGIGWWQIVTQYVDDAVFDQEIRLKEIKNPLAVFCDAAAVEPCREDAGWMAVVETWPRRKFQRKYPKAAIADVDTPDVAPSDNSIIWANADFVLVACYYKRVPETRMLALLESGATIDITGKGEAELGQIDQADPIQGTRECECYKVCKYLVTGQDVLEGPIEWAGKYIPLIPVIGAETPLKNNSLRYGVVRFARDPQQMANFYATAKAEAIALAPKAPYVATQKQIGPFKAMWDTLNTENRPYLLYAHDPEAAGPPKREHPPEMPQALAEGELSAIDAMKRTTGVYDASLGARSNETSGIAIARREDQGDNANSHFADNLVHSLVHTGRCLIDLIPKIYDNQRTQRLLADNGEEFKVTINQQVMSDDGAPVLVNDLSAGRFDVRVTVGRSYATQRIEALNSMVEFAKSLPPQAQLLFLDLIVKSSDWPGAEEISKRLRSLVPAEALADPDDPNAPQPPGPMDDPSVVAQLEKLAAEIDKLRAEAAKTLAEADKLDGETGQIMLPQIVGQMPSQQLNGQGSGQGAPEAPENGPMSVSVPSVPMQASLPPPPPDDEGGALRAA